MTYRRYHSTPNIFLRILGKNRHIPHSLLHRDRLRHIHRTSGSLHTILRIRSRLCTYCIQGTAHRSSFHTPQHILHISSSIPSSPDRRHRHRWHILYRCCSRRRNSRRRLHSPYTFRRSRTVPLRHSRNIFHYIQRRPWRIPSSRCRRCKHILSTSCRSRSLRRSCLHLLHSPYRCYSLRISLHWSIANISRRTPDKQWHSLRSPDRRHKPHQHSFYMRRIAHNSCPHLYSPSIYRRNRKFRYRRRLRISLRTQGR